MTVTIHIHPDDIGEFIVPPECAGQMIELSFAVVAEYGIVRRTYDRADRSIVWHVVGWDCVSGGFHPHNRCPSVPAHAWWPCTVSTRQER